MEEATGTPSTGEPSPEFLVAISSKLVTIDFPEKNAGIPWDPYYSPPYQLVNATYHAWIFASKKQRGYPIQEVFHLRDSVLGFTNASWREKVGQRG